MKWSAALTQILLLYLALMATIVSAGKRKSKKTFYRLSKRKSISWKDAQCPHGYKVAIASLNNLSDLQLLMSKNNVREAIVAGWHAKGRTMLVTATKSSSSVTEPSPRTSYRAICYKVGEHY